MLLSDPDSPVPAVSPGAMEAIASALADLDRSTAAAAEIARRIGADTKLLEVQDAASLHLSNILVNRLEEAGLASKNGHDCGPAVIVDGRVLALVRDGDRHRPVITPAATTTA